MGAWLDAGATAAVNDADGTRLICADLEYEWMQIREGTLMATVTKVAPREEIGGSPLLIENAIDGPGSFRCAGRGISGPGYRHGGNGFRCARTP